MKFKDFFGRLQTLSKHKGRGIHVLFFSDMLCICPVKQGWNIFTSSKRHCPHRHEKHSQSTSLTLAMMLVKQHILFTIAMMDASSYGKRVNACRASKIHTIIYPSSRHTLSAVLLTGCASQAHNLLNAVTKEYFHIRPVTNLSFLSISCISLWR